MFMRKEDGTKVRMGMGNVRENYGGDDMPTWQKVLIAVAVVLVVAVVVWVLFLRKKGTAASAMGFSKNRWGFRFY
jgi:ABC-type uncharacterized transport system permease subunit